MEILSVTIPLFILLIIGYICRKKGIINDSINDFLSKAVYYVAFPALTFRSVASSNFRETFNMGLVAVNVIMVTGIFVLAFALAFLIKDKTKRGSFTMTAFRSNQGYMGIPIILSFYNPQAMAKGAIINSFDSVNVIFWSVLALEIFGVVRANSDKNTVSAKMRDAGKTARKLLVNFITNPFLISAVLGLTVSYFQLFSLVAGGMIDKTLVLAQNTALPLAMIMIGASISLNSISKNLKLVLSASLFKLILSPIVGLALGMAFGFTGEDLGICMLFGAMPSAVSSYVMAKEMGADEELCAATIGFTTLVSIVTISAFKFVLDNIILKGSII